LSAAFVVGFKDFDQMVFSEATMSRHARQRWLQSNLG
jgi:hypothetical protein